MRKSHRRVGKPFSGRPASGFNGFASTASYRVGTPLAFYAAMVLVVVWLVTGPILKFSDGWQLLMNTATSVITFLMVFLLQATQNRDAKAIHLKLDELIRACNARDNFAGIEIASDDELDRLQNDLKELRESLVEPKPTGDDEQPLDGD